MVRSVVRDSHRCALVVIGCPLQFTAHRIRHCLKFPVGGTDNVIPLHHGNIRDGVTVENKEIITQCGIYLVETELFFRILCAFA